MYKTFTFYFSIVICLSFLLSTNINAQIWTGNGDGTSWTDSNNWDSMTVPTTGGIVEILQTATISGEAPSEIAQLVIGDSAIVMLDVDLTIRDSFHAIVLSQGGALTLGNGETERTITLSQSNNRIGISMNGNQKVSELTISKKMSLNITSGSVGISNNARMGVVVNDGSIMMTENVKTGIRGARGEIINNGTITCEGLPKGLQLSGGKLTNEKTININQYQSLGMDIYNGSRLTNNGTINTAAAVETKATSYAYLIGQDSSRGTLINRPRGIIINNGGETARGISVAPMGQITNRGKISLEGLNKNGSMTITGKVTNDLTGLIDLGIASAIVSSNGLFENHGLLKNSRTGFLVTVRDGSTFINNGFYQGENTNNLANGDGTITNNGINLQEETEITIDADGTCVVDIAEAPYRWLEGDQLVGIADSIGNLTLAENSITSSPVTLTTNIEGVAITLTNVCPEAIGAVISSLFSPNLEILSLNIYPTLVRAQKTLSVDLSTMPNDPIEFSIINQLGQVMKVQTIDGGVTSGLDIHSLPIGQYWITGQQEAAQLVGKFTIAQ